MTGDGKVIVGGAFSKIGVTPALGLAALDAVSGEFRPWEVAGIVQNSGTSAAIQSLASDSTAVYGTGYVFGPGGNLEGTFSADAATGAVNWIEDRHGDTYGAFPVNDVVYTVSHAHYCGNIGGYFQSDPWAINMRHALAFTKTATGTIGRDPLGYYNWEGKPSPSLVNWFPNMDPGKFTGQNQAAWSVTGNAQYVVLGGEFPTVNGAAQQGLTRFAVKPIAPAKRGPVLTGSKFMPNLVSLSSGTVRVAFQTNWDQDDLSLSYKVVRDGNLAAPVFQTVADPTFWNRPNLGFTDTGLSTGRQYRDRLYVTDSAGNTVAGDTAYITVPAGTAPSNYANTVLSQGAGTYWRLGENGGTAYDWAGFSDGVKSTGVSGSEEGAPIGDPDVSSDV